jgi:NAD(P)-dependent dehydrogenase (short-subunit alcohol dehydrogenase family)
VQGKHILITGATSGIGLAAAQALAALDASVAIVGRNETRTRVAAAAISATAKAATVTTFVGDIAGRRAQAGRRGVGALSEARCAGQQRRRSELPSIDPRSERDTALATVRQANRLLHGKGSRSGAETPRL